MRLGRFGSVMVVCIAAILPMTAAADSSLYAELGGKAGLERITAGMLSLVSRDPRTAAQFDNINFDWLRPRITLYFCQRVGGPCRYPGRDMRSAHVGLHVMTREFNALVEDLQISMDHEGIPFAVQNRFLAVLAPLQREIVAH